MKIIFIKILKIKTKIKKWKKYMIKFLKLKKKKVKRN